MVRIDTFSAGFQRIISDNADSEPDCQTGWQLLVRSGCASDRIGSHRLLPRPYPAAKTTPGSPSRTAATSHLPPGPQAR